jgi:hypothetical protein
MSAELKKEIELEIAHILLIDVVGYSKLLVNEQIELLQQLNRIVRSTECFQAAESTGKLTRVPTGDGMALLFFRSPEQPPQCALEISQALRITRTSNYAWEFTAGRSLKLPMLTTGRTSPERESTWRSG